MSKEKDPIAFFQANEQSKYTVESKQGGVVWGKQLDFDGQGQRQVLLDSGYDQGAERLDNHKVKLGKKTLENQRYQAGQDGVRFVGCPPNKGSRSGQP